MKILLLVIATLTFAACSKPSVTKSDASPTAVSSPKFDPNVEFLLTSAATDFKEHRPPDPARFRNVRVGHITSPEGEKQYRMCGEFLPKGDEAKDEWKSFATIKTSGYEQWLGSQAASYCQGSSFVWDDVGDLSSELQSRLDRIR